VAGRRMRIGSGEAGCCVPESTSKPMQLKWKFNLRRPNAGHPTELQPSRLRDSRVAFGTQCATWVEKDEASTVVGASFEAVVNAFGYIELRRRG
jgi:hypothetical protein